MNSGISYVSIGVADMQAVTSLWVDIFGLEVVARRAGPDPELAKLWGINASDITDQLLLLTPGARTGRLHFVEFASPGMAVRGDAAPYDPGAKNLDINCSDLSDKVAQLKAAGYTFRSDIIGYNLDGVEAREVQMPAHDGLNIAFIEVLSEGFETPYTTRGFAAVTSFVVVVPDIEREARFYRDVFGFDGIMQHRLSGPDIEKVIGLPSGASVHMKLCGKSDNMFGRMELIHYEGLDGIDRFKSAEPPATGILRCGFQVESIEIFAANAAEENVTVSEPLAIDAVFGTGRIITLESPAGLRIELLDLH